MNKFRYIGLSISTILIFIVFFMIIAARLKANDLVQFDVSVISYIQSFISTKLTNMMNMITGMGSIKFFSTAVILIAIALWYVKKKSLALFMILSSGLGGLFNLFLKWIFKRERPDIQPLIIEKGYSFPSGHSMGSFIFYGSVAYLIIHLAHKKSMKWLGVLFMLLLILTIGVSRIYLGVHFPSDVIAGFAAGGAWLFICIIGFRYYEDKKNI